MSNQLAGGIKAGSTNLTVFTRLIDKTTGLGKTGLTYSSVSAYYCRDNDSIQTISLSASTFTEVSATGAPGLYKLTVPDAALATGANAVCISVTNANCFEFIHQYALEQYGAYEVYSSASTIADSLASLSAYTSSGLTDLDTALEAISTSTEVLIDAWATITAIVSGVSDNVTGLSADITELTDNLPMGNGAIPYPVEFKVSGQPVGDVKLWVTKDLNGEDSGVLEAGYIYTNQDGDATFMLDTGFYWIHWYKSGEVNYDNKRIQVTA